MSPKQLHITFGFSGNATLIQSKFIDPEQGEIVSLTDPLAIGTLCDLDDQERINSRKEWLQKSLGSIESEKEQNFIDDNLALLKSLIDSANKYEKIYLWLGDEANEKLTTARLLFYLQNTSTPIYKLNFNKMEFKNLKGERLDLSSLQILKTEQISTASKQFEKLSSDEITAFATLWESVRTEPSTLRVFDKKGKYLSGDDSFFDSFLLQKSSDTPQVSSTIVGYSLCNIWDCYGGGNVGDIFLFYRLNELAKEGKINISNRDLERPKILFDVVIGTN